MLLCLLQNSSKRLSIVAVIQLLSYVRLFVTPWTVVWTSLSPGACSNSHPLCQWCHPIIASSVVPFSSCPQSFPASGSFPMNQLYASGGQCTGASASVLPMSFQGSFPLRLTGLISLCRKDSQDSPLAQFKTISSPVLSILYGPTLTSIRNCWKNHSFDYKYLCQQSDVSAF